MNKLTTSLARILIAVPFLALGLVHLTQAPHMAGAVPAYVPGGVFWIYFTGLALLLAAVAFISGKQRRLAGYLAALLVTVFAVTVQLPGMTKVVDPSDAVGGAYKMAAFAGFFKDLGLVGASLLIAGTSKEG